MLQGLKFGKFDIPKEHVIAASVHSFAFVNLKPLSPGTHTRHTCSCDQRHEMHSASALESFRTRCMPTLSMLTKVRVRVVPECHARSSNKRLRLAGEMQGIRWWHRCGLWQDSGTCMQSKLQTCGSWRKRWAGAWSMCTPLTP